MSTEQETGTGAYPQDPESLRRDGPDRAAWRAFGPYLSDRQWGTVREDTSADGDAWRSFPEPHAVSRAYGYGEDGLAGFSDDEARMCLAVALWNEADPILKERMFGLANAEGNHGEDVKEYWFHLDATPTASYLKLLYKYPQAAFPYPELVQENAARGRDQPEYELLDTGIFDEHRYFDVLVEYAKATPDDICLQITAANRGPDPAPLHVLPTLWFRNTWQFEPPGGPRPTLTSAPGPLGAVLATHPDLGEWVFTVEDGTDLLFCDNETNTQALFGTPGPSRHPKDAIHDHVVHGRPSVNPDQVGTKASAHHRFVIPPGESVCVRVRLTRAAPDVPSPHALTTDFDAVLAERVADADAFYAGVARHVQDPQQVAVLRRALAGMLWSQQFFDFPVAEWMRRRGDQPFTTRTGRNARWPHLRAHHVISMPDSWEYPWFAAWDLAFHTVALALVDLTLAKEQLELLLSDNYLHPDGQVPAYEWSFDDVNPPVHAWAAMQIYAVERTLTGREDVAFLKRVFDRQMATFTWWVNRKDPDGSNLFEGGFLGLDNIGVFDRSHALPVGGTLEQSDGTAWMALLAQTMARMAGEIARKDPAYRSLVRTFSLHYLWIAAQVYGTESGSALWDEQDGFFYDSLLLPDGSIEPLKVRSLVGLLPLAATLTVVPAVLDTVPELPEQLRRFAAEFGDDLPLLRLPQPAGRQGRQLVSLVTPHRLPRVLQRMLDEAEFLSPHGIRSLSKVHAEHPFVIDVDGVDYSVDYEPGASRSGMFGGNSNWRGPVWFPMNLMLVHALQELDAFYGDDLTVDLPTGSEQQATCGDVARELSRRLVAIFLPDADGDRPVNGGDPRWRDEHWRDHVLFYEYFRGDTGAGLGASHQTGWTGLVAVLIHQLAQPATDPT